MSPEQAKAQEELTAADLVERLTTFDGPPGEFLGHLLAVQCRLAEAEAGAMCRVDAQGRMEVLTAHPPLSADSPAPMWVSQAAEAAGTVIAEGKTTVVPVHGATDLYGDAPDRHLILLPIRHTAQDGIRGMSAFLIRTRSPGQLQTARERLELSRPLLQLYEMQLMHQQRRGDMRRLRDSLETVSAVNDHDRFRAAAMALCNEFAARWSCARVSLGFHRGRGIRLAAISHTENFSRKMKLIQDLEATMEECLDQDVEVVFPSSPEATFVSRAAGRLSDLHGPANVCSLPLRHGGRVKAVLTVEREREAPFDAAALETMRLTANLVTARLVNLHDHDRWFGAKLAVGVRRCAAGAVGPKHTWAKLLALGVVAGVLFLILAKGEFSVSAPFVLQAVEHQVISAPYDGILDEVNVELGQEVTRGQLLGKLDTDELERRRAIARYELRKKLLAYDVAKGESKQADAELAKVEADKVRKQIELLDYQIRQAHLRAPIDGTVVVGDLKRQIGAAVKIRDVLFEVAPVRLLRAELDVDERDVHELREGQRGHLAISGQPDRHIPLKVYGISPMAQVTEGQNVFKVRVELLEVPRRMKLKPGMAGVARIGVDRRHYAVIWSRRAVNWLRLKLWF